MDSVLAMILAGGRVGELSVLTLKRAKAALPFGGAYRIIDFPLSNLMQSGIGRVGILSQYRPYSLTDHVEVGDAWDLNGRNRGVRMLPPYKREEDTDWYKGTADALYQNISFIEGRDPEIVLVMSGDHIYNMDYRPLIEGHRKSGAGMTMCVKPVAQNEAGRYGIAQVDGEGRVIGYEEKPQTPRSNMASLTIYAFDARLLVEELRHNARNGKIFQIYSEIIPRLVAQNQVRAHVFDGYWAYARTFEDYYHAHMDLLGEEPVVDLNRWRIRTNMEQDTPPARGKKSRFYSRGDLPPARVDQGQVVDSLVAEGAVVAGRVEGSVLSPGVVVEPGAVVRGSILMHRVHVQKGAVLDRVISDKDAVFGVESQVGIGELPGTANHDGPTLLRSGLVVVGKGAEIPRGCRVGRNVILYPGLSVDDFPRPAADREVDVEDGLSLRCSGQHSQWKGSGHGA